MRRRAYLRAAILTPIPIAGCTSTESTTNDPNTDEDPQSSTPTQKSSTKTLVDETLYSKTRYPVDLTAGDVLHFEVTLEKGTLCLVDIASVEAGENVFKKRIRTTAEFTYTVEHDGTHYITFQGMDKARVRVVRT